MGRVIRADTIRLNDFINLDYIDQPNALSFGRKGRVHDIRHVTSTEIEVALVDGVHRHARRLALSNASGGADMVWRM